MNKSICLFYRKLNTFFASIKFRWLQRVYILPIQIDLCRSCDNKLLIICTIPLRDGIRNWISSWNSIFAIAIAIAIDTCVACAMINVVNVRTELIICGFAVILQFFLAKLYFWWNCATKINSISSMRYLYTRQRIQHDSDGGGGSEWLIRSNFVGQSKNYLLLCAHVCVCLSGRSLKMLMKGIFMKCFTTPESVYGGHANTEVSQSCIRISPVSTLFGALKQKL